MQLLKANFSATKSQVKPSKPAFYISKFSRKSPDRLVIFSDKDPVQHPNIFLSSTWSPEVPEPGLVDNDDVL
jgi:hypothetical protein